MARLPLRRSMVCQRAWDLRSLKVDIEFFKAHDGGEGFIGDGYIIFWRVEEVVDFNREYEVGTYAPGIFWFASNGGGEGYGFDTSDVAMPVVRVPFIGMDRQHAILVARDIPDLFAQLAEQDG